MSTRVSRTTQFIEQVSQGNREAADQILPIVYDELKQLAAHYMKSETPGHSLQPTALVHEAFLRLVDQDQVSYQGQTHFFALGAQAMRRILVDHARSRGRQRRGGDRHSVAFDEETVFSRTREEDILVIDDLLQRLAELDSRQAQIVELRFFGGLKVDDVAEALDLSKRTIEAEWTMARAWLRSQLSEDGPT
jgi:RNA polymerase sigma factor (TIGR02999 family)